MYKCGYVSHSVLFVLFFFLARCDRMSIRHLLLIPGFHRHISCTSLNSRSCPLSLNSVCFDRSSMRCQRCTDLATSNVSVSLDVSRQHVTKYCLSLWYSFHHNPWQRRSSSFFVGCDFLCQLQFRSPNFLCKLSPLATSSLFLLSFPIISVIMTCAAER